LVKIKKSVKRNLELAQSSKEPEIIFHFSYMALIKIGYITLPERDSGSKVSLAITSGL